MLSYCTFILYSLLIFLLNTHSLDTKKLFEKVHIALRNTMLICLYCLHILHCTCSTAERFAHRLLTFQTDSNVFHLISYFLIKLFICTERCWPCFHFIANCILYNCVGEILRLDFGIKIIHLAGRLNGLHKQGGVLILN